MELNTERDHARKLRFAARAAARALGPGLPPALALTDPERAPDPMVLAHALPPGYGLVYRHFGAADRVAVAARLSEIAADRHLTLLISADPKLAWTVGAAGVHWPERLAGRAKYWVGAFSLMTASTHGASALHRPAPRGIDARLISVVFPSGSPSATQAMGALRYRFAAARADGPVYALGGVTAGNALQVTLCGGFAGVEIFSKKSA